MNCISRYLEVLCEKTKLLGFLLLILSISGLAICQGILEPTLYGKSVGAGARAFGMGGAFIAVADDATASSWNPAGLCILSRPEGSVVWRSDPDFDTELSPYDYTIFVPNLDQGVDYTYQETGMENSFSQTGNTFDFASATYPLQIGSWSFVPQFNYQRIAVSGYDPRQSPFNFTVHDFLSNGDDFGTYSEIGDSTGEYSGGLDVYAGSIGVSFTPKINFGIALNWWTGGANGERTFSFVLRNPTGNYVDFEGGSSRFYRIIDEDLSGFNVNVGVLLLPSDKVHFGFVYKSPFSMDYSLNVARVSSGVFGRQVLANTRETTETGKIDWPATYGAGVAFLPWDVWTLSVDYTKTQWSSADYSYQSSLKCINNCAPDSTERLTRIWPLYFNPADAANGFNTKQEDTYQLRFGTEYVANWGVHIPLRAGFFRDKQLFTDAAGNDVIYNGWSAGAGVAWSHILVDFAYVHESGDYRGRDYSISNGSQTETLVTIQPDRFRSNTIYLSTIFRL